MGQKFRNIEDILNNVVKSLKDIPQQNFQKYFQQ